MKEFIFNFFEGLGLSTTNTLNILGLTININFAETLTTLALIICIIAFIFFSNALLNILGKYIHRWSHKWFKGAKIK